MTAAQYRSPRRSSAQERSCWEVELVFKSIRRAMCLGRVQVEHEAGSAGGSGGSHRGRIVERGRRTDASRRSTVSSGLRHVDRRTRCRERAGVVRLMVGRRRREGNEDRRNPPREQLGRGHRAGARQREIGGGVCVGDRRGGTHAPAPVHRRSDAYSAKLEAAGHPDEMQVVRDAPPHPVRDDAVHRERALTAAVHGAARDRRWAGSPTSRAPRRDRDGARVVARSAHRCR